MPEHFLVTLRDKLAIRRRRNECHLRIQAPLNLPTLDSANDLRRDAADGRFDIAVEREEEIEQLLVALNARKDPMRFSWASPAWERRPLCTRWPGASRKAKSSPIPTRCAC